MNRATQTVIGELAKALFPVGDWVKTKLLPADLAARSVWRAAGQNPAITAFPIAQFIETLNREDRELDALRAQWARLARAPLVRQALIGRRMSWRRQRKLETGAGSVKFGAVASGNMPLSERRNVPNAGNVLVATARADLYHASLAALVDVARHRGLIDAAGRATSLPFKAWEELSAELRQDGPFPGWPEGIAPPAAFLRQFLKDVMYCALGYRAGHTGLQEVVAVEAGDRRRPGNHGYRADAADAVRELERRMGLNSLP